MTIYDERDSKIEESQLDNPYSFTGREHDSETGLHYHRARYYDPNLARWISEDPIEFNSGDIDLPCNFSASFKVTTLFLTSI